VIVAWILAAENMIAPYVFDGYSDSRMFNGWLKKSLLPELKKGAIIKRKFRKHKHKFRTFNEAVDYAFNV